MHIPYDGGEKTNYTSAGQAVVATEIDYILVSKHIGVAQKGKYRGVSTHMALVCAHGYGVSASEGTEALQTLGDDK